MDPQIAAVVIEKSLPRPRAGECTFFTVFRGTFLRTVFRYVFFKRFSGVPFYGIQVMIFLRFSCIPFLRFSGFPFYGVQMYLCTAFRCTFLTVFRFTFLRCSGVPFNGFQVPMYPVYLSRLSHLFLLKGFPRSLYAYRVLPAPFPFSLSSHLSCLSFLPRPPFLPLPPSLPISLSPSLSPPLSHAFPVFMKACPSYGGGV